MLARFVRFLVLFDALLLIGVIVFLHYGIAKLDIADSANVSAWLTLADWSMYLVLSLFYLLLAALIVIFVNYVRRAKK